MKQSKTIWSSIGLLTGAVIANLALVRETGAVLCMADQLGAFDQDNLIVPISLI